MAKVIKNDKDLRLALRQIANKMLKNMQDVVYDVIKQSINEYYDEYNPTLYERTYRFLASLIKTDIKYTKNEVYCEVKIDEDYLKYKYPYKGRYPSYPHHYDGRFAQGIDVVNWANRKFPDDDESGGNHGYTVGAGRNVGFWDSAISDIGNIMELFKKNLKKQGINFIET